MKNGMLVADSDMHVFEPPDLWQRYIDPAYRHAAPVGLTEMRRDMRVKVKSHVVLRIGAVRPVDPAAAASGRPTHDPPTPHAEARGWDPTSQLRGDGRRGPRRRGAVPDPRALRPRHRLAAADRAATGSSPTSPPRSRAPTTTGCTTSARSIPSRMFGCGDGGAARRRPRGRRGAPLRRGARLQGHLPRPGQRQPHARGTTAPTTRCGPSASGSTCRSASTAAARPTSSPTSRSRCSTS